MTRVAASNRASGSRTSRLKKVKTPIVCASDMTGKTNMPRMLMSRASVFCSTRGSLPKSATHSGSPDCQTRPTKPAPGANATVRECCV